ncbi:hypothetical protein HK098_000605 [Nowakowskiella sp. JEL0407]|nr:hypothetical protein HK098_000605 [Nowakowskiella sp. JEL0407]
MYHPLVDRDGNFSIRQAFPVWREGKDCIVHVLHYMRNSFKEAVLSNLQSELCHNREALRQLLHERALFQKLAIQSAQLSCSESVLYEEDESTIINFTKLTDDQFKEIKERAMGSESNLGTEGDLSSTISLMDGFKKVTTNVAKMIK